MSSMKNMMTMKVVTMEVMRASMAGMDMAAMAMADMEVTAMDMRVIHMDTTDTMLGIITNGETMKEVNMRDMADTDTVGI